MMLGKDIRCILAYRHPVDMRKSFTGLIALVQHSLHEDPLSGSLFVFFNRRGNYMKSIFWDRTGYSLFAKKLERGHFTLPGEEAKQELSRRSLELLLDGIPLGLRKRIR